MPITYTNRKGVLYFLCQTVTQAGKTRYYFARQPKGEPVEEIPAGHKIVESVNGVVSLARDIPSPIRPQEVAIVEAAVRRLPKARNYRVSTRQTRIVVYELVAPDVDELIRELSHIDPHLAHVARKTRDDLQDTLDRRCQYEAVLRFTLVDPAKRTFRPARMTYSGHGGWHELWSEETGPLAGLAERLIPTLGTDDFFDLH
jgi:hypothetical protein